MILGLLLSAEGTVDLVEEAAGTGGELTGIGEAD